MENQCGIIILAAGSSTRLGTAKQLLQYKQTTLLENSITAALDSLAKQVVVVLGNHADKMHPAIKNNKLSVIVNNQWQEGIAASIRQGLSYLTEQYPAIQTAIFMVCDQPYITADVLNELISLQMQSGDAIVASKYADTIGIPAIFNKSTFDDLLQLKGDAGAKKIILQQQEIKAVSFPLGNIDIDTTEDYHLLQKM